MLNNATDPKPQLSSYAWLVVAMLCIVGGLNYLDRMMITTMRSSIVAAIPMTEAQFGLLTSIFLWIYGLLSPAAGYLADRFNRSKVIIGSLFVWSVVTWLTSRATTFEELLIARALMGISEACYIPAALALIVDYHRGPTRSKAVGIHMAGIYIGQSLGFIGGWLAESRTWNFAFAVFGVVGVVYAIILAFSLRDSSVRDTPVRDAPARATGDAPARTGAGTREAIGFGDAIKNLIRQPAYLLALAAWGLLGVVSWMINGWLPTYYKEHFNLSQTQAGIYATTYFFIPMLVGVLSGGALADFWDKTNKRARILLPALGLIVATPAIFVASNTDMLWLAVAAFMIYAFARPFLDANMMPILCMVADQRYLATGYGILNLFSCIVGGVGIYVGGALRDAHVNLSAMFQVAALTMLFCAWLLFKIKPKNLPEPSQGLPSVKADGNR
ncbi:Sugar phosphate permease [Dyadobacter sp. SG02]|uniref:MFS transporter n=1 Tax=Dyadobacter sp. SG02 TaxID=1855291 RepID=UPI0008B9FFDF|nr:MFS transporter [Dyadobacter sp. SG02]SEJ58523.1 Sugar phosphate permease [Dyadobacter sp. SG02]